MGRSEDLRYEYMLSWRRTLQPVKKPLTAETAETAEKKILSILGELCVLCGKNI